MNNLVISFLNLRKTIGRLGLCLPFVLMIGGLVIFNISIQSSISAYYHTDMGDVFVGILFAIGIFLFAYKGHDGDDKYGDIACFSAIGVALFPTEIENNTDRVAELIGYVHLAFTSVFFLTLSFFCLCLFTKTLIGTWPTPEKLFRNKIYRTCGWLMLLAMGLMIVEKILTKMGMLTITSFDPIFWLETIAIVAFSFSWMVKGDALFSDADENGT